jgi:hypothetical protein
VAPLKTCSVPYEEFHGEIEEIVDLENGVIFAVIAASGRLDGSSGGVQVRLANISTCNAGAIEQQTAYTDVDDARAAAERLAEERG